MNAYADAALGVAGLAVWAYGATHGDRVAANVGFLAVFAVVGTRVGLI